MKIAVGCILCILGIILLSIALAMLVRIIQRRRCKIETVAMVTKIEYDFDDIDSCDKIIPTIEFQIGEKIYNKKMDENDYEYNKYDLGQNVAIVYNENNPKEFYTYSKYDNLVAFYFYLCIAVLFIFIGVMLFI